MVCYRGGIMHHSWWRVGYTKTQSHMWAAGIVMANPSLQERPEMGSKAGWLATLYVDNLTNQLGIDSYNDPHAYGNRYSATISRPRTIGITLSYSLKNP
jgi:hypothetical protein